MAHLVTETWEKTGKKEEIIFGEMEVSETLGDTHRGAVGDSRDGQENSCERKKN